MGKLKRLGSPLATLSPRVARGFDREGHSRSAEPWRKWYSLKRWKDLRWAVFLRDRFTCQMDGCGRVQPNPSRLVGDHRTPHRGDPDLFWNPDNVHTLCKSCHDSLKQAQERAAPWGRGVSKV